MAIVRNNPLLMGMSGSIGKQITLRQLGGQTVMSKYRGPASVPPTEAQLSVRDRFAKAVAYARKSKIDQTLAPLYQAAASPGHSPYHLALRDALSVPVVSQVECNGYSNTITVTAKDIIRLRSVSICIRTADGILMEEGPARWQPDSDEWIYPLRTTKHLQKGTLITALACDFPGNSTLSSLILEDHHHVVDKAATACGCPERQTTSDTTKVFSKPAFTQYIESRAREPDKINKALNVIDGSQIRSREWYRPTG